MNPTKDIRPYLHLYLGCEVDTNIPGGYVHPYGCTKIRELNHETLSRVFWVLQTKEQDKKYGFNDSDHIYFKPILRRLSSMSDDEKIKLYDDWYPSQSNEVGRDQKINFVTNILSPKGVYTESNVSFIDFVPIIQPLLSQGFWLLGDDWFDEGIIIDADKRYETLNR